MDTFPAIHSAWSDTRCMKGVAPVPDVLFGGLSFGFATHAENITLRNCLNNAIVSAQMADARSEVDDKFITQRCAETGGEGRAAVDPNDSPTCSALVLRCQSSLAACVL